MIVNEIGRRMRPQSNRFFAVMLCQGVGGSGGLFYHDKASGPVALTIDDPLRPGANIGAGSFNMHRVQVCGSGGM